MGDPFRFRVVTLLRGDALNNVRTDPAPLSSRVTTPTPDGNAGDIASASQESIYGVPVSASQHCCGRGCKHCRIYWHGKKQ